MNKHKDQLKAFFTAHWNYLVVNTACQLGLFDALEDNALSITDLAALKALEPSQLLVLMKALKKIGFLIEQEGVYQLNAQSTLLTENHPETLKYACMNWSGEHLTAWQSLGHNIKTGQSAFESLYGQTYFEYLNTKPEKLHRYQKAMSEYARDDYKQLAKIIDFSQHTSVMDVGGGYGVTIQLIQEEYPRVNCILFDLPAVVENCPHAELSKVSGDFFENIPSISDAIILARVLHDWKDEKAVQILHNCYAALPLNGTLYMIENCTDKIDIDLSVLSLNMAVMCDSFERSSSEYTQLCKKAGFTLSKLTPLNQLQSILIFKKL